ncbi:hypothetical protein KR009_011089 [Drosophila setifemur]|nr:hypothetical protein KR009_011089 [Drosophila setifemur]
MEASDDIEVRQVTAEDSEQLMAFLLEHYYPEEPLTAGTSPPEPEEADKTFLLSNIPNGTCYVALERGSSRIVGAVVAGYKDADMPKIIAEEAFTYRNTKWGNILSILAEVEAGSDVCRRFDLPSCIHVHALAVNPQVRGRGLGVRLMNAIAARTVELGQPLVCVDCTSVYSAKLMERLGYQLIHTLRYEHHLDARGQQIIQPPKPHESVQTFVLKL